MRHLIDALIFFNTDNARLLGGARCLGLRSPVSGLRSPVSGLRSPVSGLRSPVSGLRSPSSLATAARKQGTSRDRPRGGLNQRSRNDGSLFVTRIEMLQAKLDLFPSRRMSLNKLCLFPRMP